MNTTTTLQMLTLACCCVTVFACNAPKKPEPLPLGDPIFLWQNGIGIELAPPLGFEASDVQLLIADEERGIAIWYNVLERYFTDYETDYEAKSFKAMNLELYERERTMVDGKNALLLVSENPNNPKEFHRLRLGMQVASQTVEIDALYPVNIEGAMFETLKKSFLELRQNRERGENPTKAFDYRVAADSVGFQLTGIAGGSAIYRSVTADMDPDELLLSMISYPFPLERSDTLDFGIELMQSNLKDEIEIEAWDREDGMDVDRLTLLGFAQGEEKSIQVYQVLWFGLGQIHRLIAICADHHEAWLARLEQFAATFRLK